MIRAFRPILAADGGGGIINVLSALPWFAGPGTGAYSAAKAAEWTLTDAVRLDLTDQGAVVPGVFLGATGTAIMAGYDGPQIDPREVLRRSLDGLLEGSIEVVVDDWSAKAKASPSEDPARFSTQISELLDRP